jgi:hypothetical protein
MTIHLTGVRNFRLVVSRIPRPGPTATGFQLRVFLPIQILCPRDIQIAVVFLRKMSIFNEEELKATYYRGLFRVPLSALNFHHGLGDQTHRELSQKNVYCIQKVFEKQGCLRTHEENFITAIVDDESLNSVADAVTRQHMLGLREGTDLPLLKFLRLDCLSGLHRVEAAKNFLVDNDQCWVVRLFSTGTGKSA